MVYLGVHILNQKIQINSLLQYLATCDTQIIAFSNVNFYTFEIHRVSGSLKTHTFANCYVCDCTALFLYIGFNTFIFFYMNRL